MRKFGVHFRKEVRIDWRAAVIETLNDKGRRLPHRRPFSVTSPHPS